MKSDPGLPMTVGNAAKAELPRILGRRSCGHQVEPDPVETADRWRRDSVLDWRKRLPALGSGLEVDMVLRRTAPR
jgi:hypothetical protein